MIKNKLLSEAVLESIIGKHGVSPAAKKSLATRVSELLKDSNDKEAENQKLMAENQKLKVENQKLEAEIKILKAGNSEIGGHK